MHGGEILRFVCDHALLSSHLLSSPSYVSTLH